MKGMIKQPVVFVTNPIEYREVSRNTTVHEHRAPTDESVRLLKEFEEKAQEKIVEAVRIGDSTFECVIHSYLDNLSYQNVLVAVFSLNGKKETAEHRYSAYADRGEGKVEALNGLRDEIAKVIATRMILSALNRGDFL